VGSGTASGEPQPFVPNQVPESTFTRQPPFKGAAVAKFGQPAVQKAYREVVNFAFNAGWNSELMSERMSKLSKRDFAGIRAFMTPSCAKAFDTLVSKALGHDKAATRELEGAAFFALAASGG